MLRIVSGMDQKNSFAATNGRALVDLAIASARLVLLVRCSTCCVHFACRRPAAKSCMAALFGSCMVWLVLLVTLLTAVRFP